MKNDKKNRISISVEPELYQALVDIKKIKGGTLAGILSEFVREVIPFVELTAKNLKSISELEEGTKEKLKRGVKLIEADMEQHGEKAQNLAKDLMASLDIFGAMLRDENRGQEEGKKGRKKGGKK